MLRYIYQVVALAASLAAASPVVVRETPATPLSTSKGFYLVANATDPSSHLAASVQDLVVQGYHTGAGRSLAVLHELDAKHPGRVFYLNGSESWNTRILSDNGGIPKIPYGLAVQTDDVFDVPLYPNEHAVSINAGNGTVARLSAPFKPTSVYHGKYKDADRDDTNSLGGVFVINGQGEGTFVACNRTVPYAGKFVITVEYVFSFGEASGSHSGNGVDKEKHAHHRDGAHWLPHQCAPINLVPKCASLPSASPASLFNHKYAKTVPCYNSVGKQHKEA